MQNVHPTVKLAVAELRETSGPASDRGGASTSTRGDVCTQSSMPTPRPPATQSSMDQFMPKSMSVAKQGQIDIALAKWLPPISSHTINLIVRDVLKVMKPTVDKVKAAVEYFHRSTVGAEKLKSTQRLSWGLNKTALQGGIQHFICWGERMPWSLPWPLSMHMLMLWPKRNGRWWRRCVESWNPKQVTV